MACAMKCDRCGKYYELRGNATGVVTFKAYNIVKNRYREGARFDICPDCVKLFNAWITEGKKEEKDDE